MEKEEVLVFVYGTLRTEFSSFGDKVCSDKIAGVMFDLGGAPGCLFGNIEEGAKVIGEVLRIPKSSLPMLDRYEGVEQGLYTREQILTEKGHECYTYQINPRLVGEAIWIKSGNWLDKGEENPLVQLQFG